MSSTSSRKSRLTRAKSCSVPVSVSAAEWMMRWAICAADMRPVARSSISGPWTPGFPARLSIPFAPRPFSHPSMYSMTMRTLRRVPSTVIGPSGTSIRMG